MNEIGKDFLAVSTMAQSSAQVDRAMAQTKNVSQGVDATGKSPTPAEAKKIHELTVRQMVQRSRALLMI
jgi:hypothetical protein